MPEQNKIILRDGSLMFSRSEDTTCAPDWLLGDRFREVVKKRAPLLPIARYSPTDLPLQLPITASSSL